MDETATIRADTAGSIPRFEHSYSALPERFYRATAANPISAPRLIKLNRPLAGELGLDEKWLESPAGVDMLAGNRFVAEARPIALAYAGHQFGGFVPQLGDGRALLLGEVIGRDGIRRDLQLKGSGPTVFSRNGDGRAALGPVLREFIVSEAMNSLGIPTTRTLAAVLTGDQVYRETVQPGAVLTRVAASHIRIGTFQYFAARGDEDGVRMLADYAIRRHYPQIEMYPQKYLAFLEQVIERQASLVASWMLVGFIHGVMNTDNMTISGETIDYGPCAFLDEYGPGTVFSSIDRNGRYSYANQPRIAIWNLARLAETLLPLLHADPDEAVKLAENALNRFQEQYDAPFHAGWRRKLGLLTDDPDDLKLAGDLLNLMAENQADFTLTFRALGTDAARYLFADPSAFDAWETRWKERIARESGRGVESNAAMQAANPKFIPRNHRIQEVIDAAVARADFGPFEELFAVLQRPFDEQPQFERYTRPPEPHERVLQTFCGT